MKQETPLIQIIRLALGMIPTVKIFRNNVGTGWVGKLRTIPGGVQLMDPRRLQCGLIEGSSDLIGWTSRTITAEDVGKKVAIFTAIEVKTEIGRASPQQINFLNQVRDAGGISGAVKSPEEAKKLLAL